MQMDSGSQQESDKMGNPVSYGSQKYEKKRSVILEKNEKENKRENQAMKIQVCFLDSIKFWVGSID